MTTAFDGDTDVGGGGGDALGATSRARRVAPALAALAYPALVWTGPAMWPPLLATALAVPAVAVWTTVRLSRSDARAARAVALAAVAAPPMFTLLGGLLDFQRALPVSGLGAWLPLWLLLAAIAWRSPRRAPAMAAVPTEPSALQPAARRRAPSRLAVAHGISALPIIAFALAHIVNQASGVAGGAAHVAIMNALRAVYRHPCVEPVLLACVAIQLVTGVILIGRGVSRRLGAFEALQHAAGAYIAVFFASHVSAVLRVRHVRNIDTDWHWLVSYDVFRDPWSARLSPYYALAVLALAVHLACALRSVAIGRGARREHWHWPLGVSVGLAVLAATLILVGVGIGHR
jgi:hypothetical protein